jgi:DNA-binding NarL/FixJ family response regulator
MKLTRRQSEVLRCIVSGKSNREIAALLRIEVSTAAAHRANIMRAVGVHKTVDLVVYAIRNSLVPILGCGEQALDTRPG